MKSLLGIFTGSWLYERRVSNPDVVVRGSAFFDDESGEIRSFKEEGSYCLSGEIYTCFQHQIWVWAATQLTILKYDGEILHVFDLTHTTLPYQLQHIHICGDDTYNAKLDVMSNNEWHTTYRVVGPRKNYTSVTVFSRQFS